MTNKLYALKKRAYLDSTTKTIPLNNECLYGEIWGNNTSIYMFLCDEKEKFYFVNDCYSNHDHYSNFLTLFIER